MKSGMIASELVFKELELKKYNTEISNFCHVFRKSWAGEELKEPEMFDLLLNMD